MDYKKAIEDVTRYKDEMASIRDAMNTGQQVPTDAMPSLGRNYERIIRPYVNAIGLREPGEHNQHGYTFKYENPIELAVKDWEFFHLNKAVQFLNLMIGRLEYLSSTDTKEEPLDDTALRLLKALIELATTSKSLTTTLPIEGIRLLTLTNSNDTANLQDAAQSLLKHNYIQEVTSEDSTITITLSNSTPLPKISDTDKIEALQRNRIKKALLFFLYERYKEARHLKAGMAPLVPLAPILGVANTTIQLYAQELIDDGLIEYAVMDGGQFTCNLTNYGAQLSRSRKTLIEEFPTLDISFPTKSNEMTESHTPHHSADPRKVFVVHGRNIKARDAMFSFLRAIGLDPIEWEEAVAMTKQGSPYIGNVLDIAFNKAKAIVVLFTGDDLAKLNDALTTTKPERLTPQPRANVLFEAGMAIGRNENQTILVELGEIRSMSDIIGRHAIRIDNTVAKRQALADRLHTAGCAVKLGGRTDWHTTGDFDSAILSHDND